MERSDIPGANNYNKQSVDTRFLDDLSPGGAVLHQLVEHIDNLKHQLIIFLLGCMMYIIMEKQ